MILFTYQVVGQENSSKTKQDSTIEKEFQGCHWDHGLNMVEVETGQELWATKWKGHYSVPWSFYVDKVKLEEIVDGKCGFRIYYALSDSHDLRTMGMYITSIDEDYQDGAQDSTDKVLYVTQIKVKDEWVEKGKGNEYAELISLKEAEQYSKNWQKYHGICEEDIKLDSGKSKENGCDSISPKSYPHPRGTFQKDAEMTEFIPISHAFAAKDIFDYLKADGGYGDSYHGILFVNMIHPWDPNRTHNDFKHFTKEEINSSKLLQYDFYVLGVVKEKRDSGDKTVTFFGDAEHVALDRSCPCPSLLPCCKDNN